MACFFFEKMKEKNYKKEMSEFQFNLMKGKIVEMIVQNIFEHCGYQVYPYGHESTLGKLKENFKNYKNHNETLEKIRCTPDFVTYNPKNENTALIEVKYRNCEKEEFQADYEKYRKHWNDCLILLVNPSSPNKYYIQFIKELKPTKEFYNKNQHKKVYYYNINNFVKIQDAFPMVGFKTIQNTLPILEALTKN